MEQRLVEFYSRIYMQLFPKKFVLHFYIYNNLDNTIKQESREHKTKFPTDKLT